MKEMQVLHFLDVGSVRLQRYLQSNLDMGIQPVVFCKELVPKNEKGTPRIGESWIPGMKRIPVEYYDQSRQMSYLLPVIYDRIGLKKIFRKYKCDFIHAHNIEAAHYAYKLGLPTLLDDWEYYYEYLDYIQSPETLHVGPRDVAKAFLKYQKKARVRKIVEEITQNVPVIVTNEEVERRYRELGATSIWSVPNVPLSYEREYALAIDVPKRERISTCYIGALSSDESSILRNASGVRELWKRNDIGDLVVFEGKNYLSHLEVLRRVRECHFNLLFWKPLPVHKYYLQNKAFLASIVGVPTVISSSLRATIDLLGDYAIIVKSLEEIPKAIRESDPYKKYPFNQRHVWEYYQSKIEKAYEETSLERA